MEPFVIDETHSSLGWRVHSPSLTSSIWVAERSDANLVVELLNLGLAAQSCGEDRAPDAATEKGGIVGPTEPATEGDTD